MGVKVREKRGKLYLDIYWNGLRSWESLKISVGSDAQTKKEAYRLAETIRSKREFQLVSGDHGLTDLIAGKQQLIHYAEKIAEKQPPKYPIPKSLAYLRRYSGSIQINAVNERWLEGYQEFLKEQKVLGPSTAAKYYSALVQILNRAVRERVINRNPATAVKGMRIPEVVKLHLTSEELKKLSATSLGGKLGGEVKRGFLFAIMTGLRISDIRSLCWGDIDREGMQITKRQEKTKRVVSIPMHETAWTIIDDKSIHHRTEPIFPLLAETKTNTNQYLNSWAESAGIEKQIGWHTARHTFAVLTLEGGADFYTVSKLLGHTKPMTTAAYAKATDGMKRKAVEGLANFIGEKKQSGT